METFTLIEDIDEALLRLRGHKCRLDSRKPAGGGVCNVCAATCILQRDVRDKAVALQAQRDALLAACERLLWLLEVEHDTGHIGTDARAIITQARG